MRLDHVDIPDPDALEVQRRVPDLTWSVIIADALDYCLRQPRVARTLNTIGATDDQQPAAGG
jgi:hypothetical protein